MKVPKAILFNVDGDLPEYVCGKDLALYIMSWSGPMARAT